MMTERYFSIAVLLAALVCATSSFRAVSGFVPSHPQQQRPLLQSRSIQRDNRVPVSLKASGRSAPRYSRQKQERSKRQERVGQLVRTELGGILHSGLIKGNVDDIDSELRQRISLVSVDVSPDLRNARVTVSVRSSTDPASNAAVDKRRAYAWLVRNVKPLRHSLAQRMSHMKASPNLSFVQVDVAAAVDVMYLIDKVAAGYKRERIGSFGENDNNMPKGYVSAEEFDRMEHDLDDDDFEEDDDDDDWEFEDVDLFQTQPK